MAPGTSPKRLNILTKNPEVWSKTIFILTYDENDGYFDHVPPFVAPEPGNPESGKTSPGIDASLEYLPLEQDLKRHPAREARGGPVGLGYRVPMIIASPWSRGGYVCSQVFDHTSVLQLLERVLSQRSGREIRETNITAWRRTVCGDLTSAFRPFEEGSAEVRFPSRDSFFEQVHRAQFTRMPSGYRKLTADEIAQFRQTAAAGARRAAIDGAAVRTCGEWRDQRRREAVRDGARGQERALRKAAAGAPFHVYTPGKFREQVKLRTRAYAVAAGDRLTDSWELEGFEKRAYHLRVCGPNGFLREFAGNGRSARGD